MVRLLQNAAEEQVRLLDIGGQLAPPDALARWRKLQPADEHAPIAGHVNVETAAIFEVVRVRS